MQPSRLQRTSHAWKMPHAGARHCDNAIWRQSGAGRALLLGVTAALSCHPGPSRRSDAAAADASAVSAAAAADASAVSDVFAAEDLRGELAAGAGLDPYPPPSWVQLGRFATSPVCAACHSNHPDARAMRDAAGHEAGPFDLWHATMMGASARDPLWRAVVSAEIDAVPSRKTELEAKCIRCHAPMAAFHLEGLGLDDPAARPLDLTLVGPDAPEDLRALALDGVSCAFCHAIDDVGLGERFSASGHPVLAAEDVLFGPHAEPFAPPMVGFTGLTPASADHVRDSALCATCHTLHTAALAPDGALTGDTLTEQAPYLEWRLSAFSTERPPTAGGVSPASCADCHLPTATRAPERPEDGADEAQPTVTRLARRPPGPDFPQLQDRAPYGHHAFVGGNTLMLGITRDNRATLAPTITDAAFAATLAATRDQLRGRTGRVLATAARHERGRVTGEVLVANLAGHKLPTGYPARRVWLRIRVLDASGRVLVASGDHDAEGRILDGRGDVAAFECRGGPVEPHRTHLASADEALIYEPVMRDAAGAPTWRLALGAGWLKDNRLLPEGFDASHPDASEVAPVGVADEDFAGGGDHVSYALPVRAQDAPVEVEIALLYQPLGARFAAELLAHQTPEVAAFEVLWQAADRHPEVVSEARVKLSPRPD